LRSTGAHFFNHVLDPLVNRRLGRTLHEDMRRMEAVIRQTDLDWTLVRPSGLFEHPVVTDYHAAETSADGVFTARADLAASMLRELEERRYVRTAMGVITTAVTPNILGVRRHLLGRRRSPSAATIGRVLAAPSTARRRGEPGATSGAPPPRG
jgi:hypothetical protein